MPKWESDCREQIKAAVPRVATYLATFITKNAGEADTRVLVMDLLQALGFSPYEEITQEYQVRGEYADYALQIEGKIVAFVEVKRVGHKLAERDLRQVQAYALNHGAEWALLTNGQTWQAYHITAAQPVIVDLFLTVDLLDSQSSLNDKVDALFYLSKEAFKRGIISELARQRAAISPGALASVILSDKVMEEVRLEVRRRSQHNVPVDELTGLVRETVLRGEVVKGI
jgi:predicted type IV restriction endonuclease